MDSLFNTRSVRNLPKFYKITPTMSTLNISSNFLTSLDGCPNECVIFNCSHNSLTSLVGGPKLSISYDCGNNCLSTLHDIHKCITRTTTLYVNGNFIEGDVLGLLLIENLASVTYDIAINITNSTGGRYAFSQNDIFLEKDLITTNDKVFTIINKYLSNSRDVFLCQDELLKLGYVEYAQL